MASSFPEQIPIVVHLLQKLKPNTLLDVGKGFGKYGFLAHEYAGIPLDREPDPAKSLAQQSLLTIDAVEAQRRFLWPHLDQVYRNTYLGRIEDLYLSLPDYDVVLMADVIEHLSKDRGIAIVQHFVKRGSRVIVTTPRVFFEQQLLGSEYEAHVSFWAPSDFRFVPFVDYQNAGAGRVFLLADRPIPVRGFGNSLLARCRRLARLLVAEFR